jgi:uncharacterized damage-inducible protein DinB
MSNCYTDYLDNLAELHTEIMKTVRTLPPEALDWVPVQGANSLCVLMVHVAGAEKFWLGDVVAGEPSGRDRPKEFQAKNLSIHDLETKLNESLGYAELVLEKLNMEDLGELRTSPRDGQQVTVAWALDHTLKHTAIHLGHIQLTRQLWDSSPQVDGS